MVCNINKILSELGILNFLNFLEDVLLHLKAKFYAYGATKFTRIRSL